MTLPSSGPLSLSAIQGEFGGSNPIGISEYYAGGGLVPTGTTSPVAGAVPSSPQTISIYNFYGTTKFTGLVVDLTSPGTSDVQVPAGAVSVLIECVAGGGQGGNGDADLGEDQFVGGGGGASGAACYRTNSLNGTDAGLNIHCVVGAMEGNSSVTATLSSGSISMSASAGGHGGNAPNPTNGGAGGVHGSASGGTTNIDGLDGGSGDSGGGGNGGDSVLLGAGIGGAGGFTGAGDAGAVGMIRLTFS